MTWTWKAAAVACALLVSAACAAGNANNQAGIAVEGEPRVNSGAEAPTDARSASAEATNIAAAKQPAQTAGTSILAWSRPASGSIVSDPVNELAFHFSPPARLSEITVTGPDGAMPMMVTAVGEVEDYSLPLSGLGPGRYTVAWQARARGVDYSGSFSFEVR